MHRAIFLPATFLTTLLCLAAAPAHALPSKELAGSIEADLDGERVVLGSLESRYDVTVSGDVANVKLTQTFENPYSKPLDARYLFPLERTAAVHAMTLRVGDEVITAEIQEIREAQRTFETAKTEGKAASLLEEHRPNMFTQRIANLMPGMPISVEIEYTQMVQKTDGAYELVIPMVVGPRYQPAAAVGPIHSGVPATHASRTGWALERLPAYPPTAGVHVPREIVGDRVHLRVALEAPVPLGAVYSDTHALDVRHVSSTQQTLRFASNKVQDNRDFVLRYALAADAPEAGLLTHWHADEGGYFSLLIEPPAAVAEDTAIPREMVFLLDCSGSMSGEPIAASKRFMRAALSSLRPSDTFRIIRFSDTATEFSRAPLAATPTNIARGLHYTEQLYGSGGTEMTAGIEQALAAPTSAGVLRNVVFLTDGYIGHELTVLALVHRLLGDARLFAFGVGAGVNRYLLDEIGRLGRGFTRYYDPTRDDESQDAVVGDLVSRLQTPVLTDLAIDWGPLIVTNLVPERLPDLYAGDSIRLTGRFAQPATGEITISGISRDHAATFTRTVTLDRDADRPALRRIWARNTVARLMHDFIAPPELRPDAMTDERLQAAVTDLGLGYGIATRWTAFVAVSRKVFNAAPETNLEGDVAVPQVAGVSAFAYPPGPTGGAAPEPGLLLGVLVALFACSFGRRMRRAIAG